VPGIVIIGVGPGIGTAVARRFAREGLPVALVARSAATVATAAKAVEELGVQAVPLTADASVDQALKAALDTANAELGPPDAVVYNAAVIRPDTPGELSVAEHQRAWAVNVVGAITTAAHVLPEMARRGTGTYLITSGMPRPKAAYTSLSLGKAGVRALADLLDQEYGPSGVRVATVTVAGHVAPGSDFDPDEIAETYWDLHARPRDAAWQPDVLYRG
jgi:NAD(P)-dependent dehydrogenase (short-subunit alcohol dehydrogenase family)